VYDQNKQIFPCPDSLHLEDLCLTPDKLTEPQGESEIDVLKDVIKSTIYLNKCTNGDHTNRVANAVPIMKIIVNFDKRT